MKKIVLTAVATAALAPLCATAQADTHSSETASADMYVQFTAGKGKHNLSGLTAAQAAAFDKDVSTMSLIVGMDLNETFAIEGFYKNLGKSKFIDGTTLTGKSMGIAVNAGTDLTEDFRGFLRVGYGSWKTKSTTNDDGTDILYGAGVEYKLTETTAIVAGYEYGKAKKSNVTDTYLGVKYRF